MLVIDRRQLNQIVQHCRDKSPIEACGLVAGRRREKAKISEEVYPCENALNSAVRYEIEPNELLRAIEDMESKGKDLIAIYHSHLGSGAKPSRIDIMHAFYPSCSYLIVSLGQDRTEVKSWTLRDGIFEEEPLEIRE
jgi:proteasome lid subunit RPN8/RPN11